MIDIFSSNDRQRAEKIVEAMRTWTIEAHCVLNGYTCPEKLEGYDITKRF